MKSSLFDCKMRFFAESSSGKAFLASDTGSEKDAIWLPKSEAEYEPKNPQRGDYIEVTMPQWLAEDKGLV